MPIFLDCSNMKSYGCHSQSSRLFVILIVVATELPCASETLPMKEPRLTEEQGREKLAQYASTWHNREEWELRAKNIPRRHPAGRESLAVARPGAI